MSRETPIYSDSARVRTVAQQWLLLDEMCQSRNGYEWIIALYLVFANV